MVGEELEGMIGVGYDLTALYSWEDRPKAKDRVWWPGVLTVYGTCCMSLRTRVQILQDSC